MNALTIVILVVILIVVIIMIYSYFTNSSNYLLTLTNIMDMDSNLSLTNPSTDNDANFSYGIWFYVNNWNYNIGSVKPIFKVLGQTSDQTTSNYLTNLTVKLGSTENNLNIHVPYFNPAYSTTNSDSQFLQTVCNVQNVPLQSWVCLQVSVYGRSIDVYINGKLVRTCIPPGIVAPPLGNILITKNSFDGFVSNLRYFDTAVNPQQAYNYYLAGAGIGGVFDKYRIKFTYLVDNKDKGSFEI